MGGLPVHADEPLLRRPEDHRLLGTPVMGIAVNERVVVHQVAAFPQVLDDPGVGLPDRHAAKPARHGLVVGSVAAHRAIDLQPLTESGDVVVGPVAGCGVNQTRAVGECDVRRLNDRAHPVAEGVAIGEPNQRGAISLGEPLDRDAANRPGDRIQKLRGDHGDVAVQPYERVAKGRLYGNCQVRRKRPGRCRPDHERGVLIEADTEDGRDRGPVRRLEVHVDGDILPLLILQLRLGKRRAVLDRPVHGFERPVHESLLQKGRKNLQDTLFIVRRHGQIRVVEISQRHQTLQVAGLERLVLFGVGAAGAADRHPPLVLTQGAELLELPRRNQIGHHLVLDGKAMAVPTGYEGAVAACHEAASDHKVLEHLVEQLPDVDPPVGVGRAVMEDKRLSAGALSKQRLIETRLLPSSDRGRLISGEGGSHWKARPGQVERL